MAWTAPRTYVTSETITSTILNTDHRDNLIHLKGLFKYGSGLINFPSTQAATAVAVTHGLGATPVSVQVTMNDAGDGQPIVAWVNAVGATTFTVDAYNVLATVNGNVTFWWLVVGPA